LVAFWRAADLRAGGQLPGAQGVRLTCTADPDARLTVSDDSFLRTLAPRLTKRPGPRGRWLRWAAAAMAAVAVMATLYAALPMVSRSLAVMVPPAWERGLGEQLAEGLEKQWGTCGAPAGNAALGFLTSRLAGGLPDNLAPRVAVVRRPEQNAIALPGARILVFQGLLEAARGPDEVAGVLAHELTHVAERHVTAAMIRGLGVGLLVTIATGDASGSVATGAAMLVMNAYSRDDEAAADAGAVRLLERTGISPHGLADFFRRLAEIDVVPQWLSTHPAPLARAQAIEAAAPSRATAPSLTPEQWAALKGICR
jgi:beta-barrel assembly-enhancing protease